ncbi:LuxR family transcriptional regulator [Croceicoccus estronivorus]|uniref:helix-turn-helix transcriptional regulator n=1 Tax=Croceicoccus estronivorus TaxID=1172626 RepID=UPI00082C39DA|nr:helix-turn-helix transcriptional regulator [Croceicoccus estronivorus]OCC22599.1 LuxR family transcriptional regulator [Croceicoccus estronivorus]
MDVRVDPQFSELLICLYGELDGERPWDAFLETLAKWLEASYATLIITAPGTRLPGTFITPGANPRYSESYMESFFADDPFRDLPEGKVTTFSEFINQQAAEDYAAYRDYLALAAGEQVLAVDLRFDGRFEARFRVTRDKALPDFTGQERSALQALIPHLRIAVTLFEKLQLAGAEHGVFQSATEGLGLALLVLDRNYRIVSSNALAERFLDEGEGLKRSGERLTIEAAEPRKTIDRLLAEPEKQDKVTRFRVERPERGDLIATARTLDLPAIHSGTGALALFLALPGEESPLEPETVRELFGLTMAEARLAVILGQGVSLVEAAKRLGITHNTAKTQLRAIFAKTGAHRQSQLVGILASAGA